MKRRNLIILITVLMMVVVGGYKLLDITQFNNKQPINERHGKILIPTEDKIVAKYNGKELYKSEIVKKLSLLFNGKLPGDKENFDDLDIKLRENFIRSYITGKLIEEEAKKTDIEKSLEYKERLAEFASQVLQRSFLEKLSKEAVTEEKLKDSYKSLTLSWVDKEEVKASHILLNDEAEAKNILSEIKAGASFEELAKTKSKDSSRERGGDLGYFTRGQMVKSFEDVAFSLAIGDVSEPVKSDFGWHIIKVLDKRKLPLPEFNKVKSTLEQELMHNYLEKYTRKLIEDAKIELMIN
jgi:parvulin-like peptidyl-prolyl isomerase